MKKQILTILWLMTLTLALTEVHAQRQSTAWTSSYTGTYEHVHISAKDGEGKLLLGESVVAGKGTHSILGEVTTSSIIHLDASTNNIVDFTETDSDGNSIIVKAKGSPGDAPGEWYAFGVITGGTGKYHGASGTYIAKGKESVKGKTEWTAEGIVYIPDNLTAIKNVIHKETETFYQRDMKAWSSTVANMDYLDGIYVVNLGQANRYKGYDNLKKGFQEWFEGKPDPNTPELERTDWNIQVRNNVAWATFNQKSIVNGVTSYSVEARTLEKINGAWKIAQTTVSYDFNQLQNEKRFRDYIRVLNRSDWADHIGPFLNDLSFIEEHKLFRKALVDYKTSVKHLVIQGNDATAWLEIDARHVGKFDCPYPNCAWQNDPSNKNIRWEEVWKFTFDGEKFGDGFELMSTIPTEK